MVMIVTCTYMFPWYVDISLKDTIRTEKNNRAEKHTAVNTS